MVCRSGKDVWIVYRFVVSFYLSLLVSKFRVVWRCWGWEVIRRRQVGVG